MEEMVEHWKHEPDGHDYPAARDYLTLLMKATEADKIIKALQKAGPIHRKAKDILRASALELLPMDNKHVAAHLEEVRHGAKLSPVLLVRGNPLIIADGYHRVCASYWIDEDAPVPCRMV